MAEELLAGGNSGPVIRIGDTVHRPAGPWTGQVHALMTGLRNAGLDVVPEPLGLDESGREVVEYVEGDVPTYPLPAWTWDDDLLVDLMRALRAVHDVSAGLGLPREGWRRPAVGPVEVVCHGDVAPYNAVCRDGRLVALIDWDYATPGPRGWDLGYAAFRWVPLMPPDEEDGNGVDVPEQRRRLQLLCEAYGDVQPDEVLRWALARVEDLVAWTYREVAAGNPTFVATHAAGHTAFYERCITWLTATWF